MADINRRYGTRSKISSRNSEFDFDEVREETANSAPSAPPPSMFWSAQYTSPRPKTKVPLKDHLNKLPRINHLDEICNRAMRGKILKSKAKSSSSMAAFDFDESEDGGGGGGGVKSGSKRPLKAESPSKHRKLEDGAPVRSGPKKAKLNMKALGGRFLDIIPKSDEVEIVRESAEVVNIEEDQTMVSNVKDSGNCIKDGVNQTFFDEFDYLFDGMKQSEPQSVRILSVFNVTKNCFKQDFRMNIRKNNLLKTIFKELEGAESDAALSLCACALFYTIALDDRQMDFSKPALELLVKILKADEERIQKSEKPSKSFITFRKRVNELFTAELKTAEFLDLTNITSDQLILELLIFLTIPTSQIDYKEEIRVCGALDYYINAIGSILNRLDKGNRLTNENCQRFLRIERYLQLVENLTYMCSDNQNYAVNFKQKSVVRSLYKVLNATLSTIHSNKGSKIKLLNRSKNLDTVYDCMFGALRMMLNLTHGNEYTCTEIGNYSNMFTVVLEIVLFLPGVADPKHKLDCYTLGLGLLINLLGEVPENRKIVTKCRFEDSPWFDACEDGVEDRAKSTLDLLVDTFLKFHNSSKELEKQTFSEAESMCLRDEEVAEVNGNGHVEEPMETGEIKKEEEEENNVEKEDNDKEKEGELKEMNKDEAVNGDKETKENIDVETAKKDEKKEKDNHNEEKKETEESKEKDEEEEKEKEEEKGKEEEKKEVPTRRMTRSRARNSNGVDQKPTKEVKEEKKEGKNEEKKEEKIEEKKVEKKEEKKEEPLKSSDEKPSDEKISEDPKPDTPSVIDAPEATTEATPGTTPEAPPPAPASTDSAKMEEIDALLGEEPAAPRELGRRKKKGDDPEQGERVKQVVDNMIAKAGEHMEESMIESYLALLLGLLTKDEDALDRIRETLQPSPKLLIEVLKKFLTFMNMVSLSSAAASKSGMQQIRSIVHWLSAVL